VVEQLARFVNRSGDCGTPPFNRSKRVCPGSLRLTEHLEYFGVRKSYLFVYRGRY
jgi:hypothetical protein